jgi:hypothetical protein
MTVPSLDKSKVCDPGPDVRYSICTLVSNAPEYAEMVTSFVAAGFRNEFCEYLHCDNCGTNRLDAFAAYDFFLRTARGKYLVLCHQDILLCYDRIDKLDGVIRDMDARDPEWALLGNAGGIELGRWAMRITHGDGKEYYSGPFPAKVQSLDENFIVAKRSANLCLSDDLHGFHFYGTDLCQNAILRGLTAWVVDFHLLHKSSGRFDASFLPAYREICRKYRSNRPNGYIQTTCAFIPTGRAWWIGQRSLFYRLRELNKSGIDTPEVREEKSRLLEMLGRWPYRFHLAFHKIATPFSNGLRSIRKRLNKIHPERLQ